jgi:uncharacterized repeat protein (TIGR04052 family)
MILLLLACAGEKGDTGAATDNAPLSLQLPFAATVNGEPFACGQTFEGLGTGPDPVELLDLRFYVHSLALLDAAGAATPVALTADGVWQSEEVALLDFEDGIGGCATGSPETHTTVTGTAPAGDYVGLAFQIGVPAALNHLDAATAAPPLNDTGLWWSWTGGYKFLKIDARTARGTDFVFHLGATNCEKQDDGSYTCTLDNEAGVTLADFDPTQSAVSIDLARLYAASDLSGQIPDGDMMPGCMSSEGDPECRALFAALGLPWEGNPSPGAQSLFSVVAR